MGARLGPTSARVGRAVIFQDLWRFVEYAKSFLGKMQSAHKGWPSSSTRIASWQPVECSTFEIY